MNIYPVKKRLKQMSSKADIESWYMKDTEKLLKEIFYNVSIGLGKNNFNLILNALVTAYLRGEEQNE
jgi:hypothetical protein